MLKKLDNNTIQDRRSSLLKQKVFDEEGQPYLIAKFLMDRILDNNPKFKKPNLQSWAMHADRMLRIDKRGFHEIYGVITWAQEDPFWQENILSTAKLRRQYDQLKIKLESESKPKKVDN